MSCCISLVMAALALPAIYGGQRSKSVEGPAIESASGNAIIQRYSPLRARRESRGCRVVRPRGINTWN